MHHPRPILAMLIIALLGTINPATAQLTPTAATSQPWRMMNLPPTTYMCTDFLALQVVDQGQSNLRYNVNNPNSLEAVFHYFEVVGWVRGYLTALNILDRTTGGHITKGLPQGDTNPSLMAWLFSHCRANPTDNLMNATGQLAYAQGSRPAQIPLN
jgi:hypothetical protein